jgi:hypothetical protein
MAYKLKTVLFWVIPRRLVLGSRRFGTPYQFHLYRQVDEVWLTNIYKFTIDLFMSI